MFFESPAAEPSCTHPPHTKDQWVSGRPTRELPEPRAVSSSSTFLSSTDALKNSTLALDIWFPVNENASSSWPPKITFGDKRPRQSFYTSPDAMEGVISQRPESTRSGRTRSATRAIPNRTSRLNSLSIVPATPTNLWREVSDPKGQDPTRLPATSPVTLNSEPIRSVNTVLKVDPRSKHKRTSYCGALLPQPAPPSASHPGPTTFVPSILTQWDQHEDMFLRMWNAQKRKNPYLPLVVSLFDPLRAFMPPLHWKTINAAVINKPSPKVEWNFQRPLPSPALRTKLRTRKQCDAAAERLSIKGILTGKLRPHCRVCSKDTLLKRLLLVRHWASESSADALFESALSLVHEEEGANDATLDDSFPEAVLLRDRHDLVDDDRPMDDAPSIVDCDSATKCRSLRLS
ncbi:hypothetical protein B0H12DRAFT_1246512 [Mycena haematopus]|nr:hypothetical protein B0H12DRAFT_1246512 [Mycena haematopus]